MKSENQIENEIPERQHESGVSWSTAVRRSSVRQLQDQFLNDPDLKQLNELYANILSTAIPVKIICSKDEIKRLYDVETTVLMDDINRKIKEIINDKYGELNFA